MIKVTDNGISFGKVREELPQEDLDEIARMFERFEHGLVFDVEGDDNYGQTIMDERRTPEP